MKFWVKILSIVLPASLILLLAVIFTTRWCLRRRRRQQLPSSATAPFTESGAKLKNDSFHSALAKLHISQKSSSSKSNHRFHHLHHHHPPPTPPPPFNWENHPLLVADAVEHGWSRFAFRKPYVGLCAACDGSAKPPEAIWELPSGSSEFIQSVRINTDGSAPFILRTSLPLPGPRLGGGSFPQESYFEITILYIQQRNNHRFPRSGKRGGGKGGEGDRAKLIRENSIDTQSESVALSPIKEPKIIEEEEGDCGGRLLVSLGLTVGGGGSSGDSSSSPSTLPGAYSGSIGFNSDGSVYLDGMKLVLETEGAEWGEVNRVIGLGFNPSKKNVFLTVDSKLVHEIHCNSDVFNNPLYLVLAAANADAMALVNMGQSPFKFASANAHRTRNPCFVRSPSNVNGGVDLGFADTRELFSMGRLDSARLDAATWKSNGDRSSSTTAFEFDAESDLFEIALHR